MWWNFVGRDHDEVVQAREDWMAQITDNNGPSRTARRSTTGASASSRATTSRRSPAPALPQRHGSSRDAAEPARGLDRPGAEVEQWAGELDDPMVERPEVTADVTPLRLSTLPCRLERVSVGSARIAGMGPVVGEDGRRALPVGRR